MRGARSRGSAVRRFSGVARANADYLIPLPQYRRCICANCACACALLCCGNTSHYATTEREMQLAQRLTITRKVADEFASINFRARAGSQAIVRVSAGQVRCRWRPYRVECTGSLPTSEVKRRRARLVLGWGTAREDLRVLPAFEISECDASCAIQRFGRTSGRVLPALLSSRKLREPVAPPRVRRRGLRAEHRTWLLLHLPIPPWPECPRRTRFGQGTAWQRTCPADGAGFAGQVLRSLAF